jgi:hypothetical protein
LPQVSIVRPARLISRDPPGNADQITRPTLAQPVTRLGMGDRAPLRAGRHHFFRDALQHRDVQHGLRQQLLELRVLLFQRPKPLGLGHLKAAKLYLPFVEGRALIPCRRYTSAVAEPASCSFNIPMICSSPNLLRFIRPPLFGAESTEIGRNFIEIHKKIIMIHIERIFYQKNL